MNMENSTIIDLSELLVKQSIENPGTSTISESPVEASIEDGSTLANDELMVYSSDESSSEDSKISWPLKTFSEDEMSPSKFPIEDQAKATADKPPSNECPPEKSQKNWEIVSTIMDKPETDFWLGRCGDMDTFHPSVYQPYTFFEVPHDTAEFSKVAAYFRATSRGTTVVRIRRVENPFLLGLFLMKREKCPNSKIMTLYHGTSKEAVDGICKSNFNWRLAGTATGYKSDLGVYFSRRASDALLYTPCVDNAVIRSKVLVDKDVPDTPQEPYETTSDDNEIYVKYEDDDFYPEYVIYFSDRHNRLRCFSGVDNSCSIL